MASDAKAPSGSAGQSTPSAAPSTSLAGESSTPSRAEYLKAEGNTFFLRKDYALAALKYTEALEVDERNAVLWANRAACRLQLKEYMDAAIDLDPNYGKAWSRLATAEDFLHHPVASVPAWRRALECLPTSNLTPIEEKQKAEWIKGLHAAEAALAKPVDVMANGARDITDEKDEMPWVVAEKILSDMQRAGSGTWKSSAWLINLAHVQFKMGSDELKQQTQTRDPKTGQMLLGTKGGILELLTNAITTDTRVVALDQEWLQRSQMQLQWEVQMSEAWPNAGPDQLMREFPARLSQVGWQRARLAFSTTVRRWILNACLDSGSRGKYDNARLWLSNAVQVLAWGSETYKSVPASDKGPVFDPTFILGVRRYLLDVLKAAYSQSQDQKILEEIYDAAQETLKEVERLPPVANPVPDPAFHLAFNVYPKAEATAALGFYHSAVANLEETSPQDAADHLTKAASSYIDAAETLPDDDELHPLYTATAFDQMRPFPVPVRTTLTLLTSIKQSVPRAERIWKASSIWKGGVGERFAKLLEAERELRQGLDAGKWTLDTTVEETGVKIP
ncbi:hypothetical protein EV715DRAFT_290149 [Schizophyllum commune]